MNATNLVPTVPPVPGIESVLGSGGGAAGDVAGDVLSEFGYDTDIGDMSVILAIMSIVLGFIFCFFGSKFFKHTLFAVAFVASGGLAFYLAAKLGGSGKTNLIVGAVVGLLLGCLVLKVWNLALFAMGGMVGFVLWVTFKALFPEAFTQEVMWAILIGLILVMGLCAIKLETFWLLLATPLVGSFLMVQGINSFIAEDLNAFQLIESQGGCNSGACTALYVSLLFLSAFGCLIQYRYTSKWADERRKVESAERKGERKAERKQRKKRRKQRRRRSSSGSYSD